VAAQIDTNAHAWHGKALTNFSRTLPPETSDLAQQVLKDPYQFDFLTLRAAAHERDVERALVTRVKDLLLELGKGFSFIASQHHLAVGGQDFYVDLLFYHRKLRRLVAVLPDDGTVPPGTRGQDELLSRGTRRPRAQAGR
jgi:predicted nuclease of restriction endonuclease-like (RecB) superfamily